MPVLLIATLDTKGREIGYVRDLIRAKGLATLVMDTSVVGRPVFRGDIRREEVFEAAGVDWEDVRAAGDRGRAVTLAAKGARAKALELFKAGQIDGVLGIGGSAGTTIGTACMRALPLGIPKVMVSTLASGQVRPFVGPRDIMLMHAVVDISGINRVSRVVLGNAAHAMVGMVVNAIPVSPADKPLICATMFGVTTPCVENCRDRIEPNGYEMLVFHATGVGGEAMESLVADGLIAGVLDITTTELADELVGGVLTAGPDRLTAAARTATPQVVSVGALDMVNFGPRDTVPPQFANRLFYEHNENVTLMRTTPEENAALGKELAVKVSAGQGPAAIVLPLKGVSAIDAEGQPFWYPDADKALFDAIRQNVASHVRLIELDAHINEPAFAECLAQTMLELRPTAL